MASIFRLMWVVAVLAVLAGVTVGVFAGVSHVSASASTSRTSSASVAILLLPLFLVAAAIPYLITGFMRILRLADGRGVRTLCPPSLRLTATVRADPGQTGHLRLLVEPRPLREVPARHRLRLALALPACHLARTLRGRPPSGYVGEFQLDSTGPVRLTWTKPPKAGKRWWRKGAGAAAGDIHLESSQVTRPWERILADSLGPGSAGRIEWVRLLITSAAPYEISDTTEVAVDAPSAWRVDLDRRYEASTGSRRTNDGPFRLCYYAMGRAVATSAGPRLDVSGEAATIASADELLDAEHLVLGRPTLVVLQAEPTDEVVDISLRDDSPERLALAADLIEAGAPSVLVLPALRTDLARAAVETIAAQTASPQINDARFLRAKLRRALKRHVEPSVLDDIVLFLNPRRD